MGNLFHIDKGGEKYVAPGGTPPYDGQVEARVAKLEAAVEHILETIKDIKTDIRELRGKLDTHFYVLGGMIIAAAVGLAGIMAKGFHWL